MDAGTRVPKASSQVTGLVALIRNQPVVVSPPGTPVPFNTAEEIVIVPAAVVVTLGAAAKAHADIPNNHAHTAARIADCDMHPPA